MICYAHRPPVRTVGVSVAGADGTPVTGVVEDGAPVTGAVEDGAPVTGGVVVGATEAGGSVDDETVVGATVGDIDVGAGGAVDGDPVTVVTVGDSVTGPVIEGAPVTDTDGVIVCEPTTVGESVRGETGMGENVWGRPVTLVVG